MPQACHGYRCQVRRSEGVRAAASAFLSTRMEVRRRVQRATVASQAQGAEAVDGHRGLLLPPSVPPVGQAVVREQWPDCTSVWRHWKGC